MRDKAKISILIPCLNEEKALKQCFKDIESKLENVLDDFEILMIDNASTDRTPEIIKKYESRKSYIKYLKQYIRGYGAAYLKGIENATGNILVMIDADCTYSFEDIPKMVEMIVDDVDMVIGNRFEDNPEIIKAMPFMNRVVGNPVLSFITRLFFNIKIGDIHCGLRVAKTDSIRKLNLHTTGMEFASEMIVKAAKQNMKLIETPISYTKRVGESKLNPFRDGWRHLAFLLVQSPLYLFFIPGVVLFTVGLVVSFGMVFRNFNVLGINFYVHPIFIFSLLMILGYQLMFFGFFGKVYAVTHLGESEGGLKYIYKYLPFKRIILISLSIIALGTLVFVLILNKWLATDFGQIDLIKESVIALTLITIGLQTLFSSFMLNVLGIKNFND